MKYSILEIAEILGADASHLNNASIDTLLTDSLTLTYPDRSLFFALHTDSNDGHRYVHQLYEKGVRNFVVEHIPEGVPTGDANFIVVKNSIKALQQLASFHRHRFHIPVIGVTGSRGKTQVKEWLFQLLRPDYNIVRSPRSYNSQIGVPLSVWDIDDNTGLAIIEAGISQPDEMPVLESIISPDITVMTNIGNEHKEGFASIEEKCIEKLRLSRNSKYIVFDGDNNTICNGIIDLSYGHQELVARQHRRPDIYLFDYQRERLYNNQLHLSAVCRTGKDSVYGGCRHRKRHRVPRHAAVHARAYGYD